MRLYTKLGVSLSILIATPAIGQVVLDFDDLPGSGRAWDGNHYLDLGVSFSALPGAELRAHGNGTSTYQSNFIYSTAAGPAGFPVIATFSQLTSFVSFNVIDSDDNAAVWTAEAFDIHGNLIDAVQGTNGSPGLPPALVLFESEDALIHQVIFTPSNDYEGIDNFAFTSIPSPSTGLVSIGSLGFLLGRRRRK